MKVQLWQIDRVKPYDRNPRRNDEAVAAVAASIEEFGFRQPIVVDEAGMIIVGHTRWKAAQKLDLAKVPVHVATDLTPEQIRAYRIADNQTATIADWDLDILAIELSELRDTGFNVDLLGFDQDELAKLLGFEPNEGLTDPDEIPEPPDDRSPGGRFPQFFVGFVPDVAIIQRNVRRPNGWIHYFPGLLDRMVLEYRRIDTNQSLLDFVHLPVCRRATGCAQ